jgi:hypothetical protein
MALQPILLAIVLGTIGFVVRLWLLRQSLWARAYVSLGLLAIAMWLFAYALYDACHGRVDLLHGSLRCAADRSVAFHPDAWRIGRAR